MLDPSDAVVIINRDNFKSIGSPRARPLAENGGRGLQASEFLGRDGFQRRAKELRAPIFHLNENHHPAVQRDKVELPFAAGEVSGDNAITSVCEVVSGELFAGVPGFLGWRKRQRAVLVQPLS